ncbi:MAG TPA: hypothetical protein PKM25_15940 [Candidatus Ozemobacteraceae bacterium]|nr:hypothetical protein [Candidatus Ozemobacteraceae bacterium]
MDQPAPVAGTEKPAFTGFFSVYLAAVVFLMIYVLIDFQVRLSPVIREWVLSSTSPDSASHEKMRSEFPMQNAGEPVAAVSFAPAASSASSSANPPETATFTPLSGTLTVTQATSTALDAKPVATDESPLSMPVSAPATASEILISNDISSAPFLHALPPASSSPVSATQSSQEEPGHSSGTTEVGK